MHRIGRTKHLVLDLTDRTWRWCLTLTEVFSDSFSCANGGSRQRAVLSKNRLDKTGRKIDNQLLTPGEF
jgi:hypothetical protein